MEFIAFDVETTGFLPGVDQIIEIAAVKFVNGKIHDSYSTLINPLAPIPAAATKVHGITDEMVKGKPIVEQALEGFTSFCGSSLMVAHNAPFDVEFIKANILKYETNSPKGIILDSCAMARKVIPGSPNYKLGTLVRFLNIPEDGAYHRAEADSRFCGQLFQIMLERIFKNGEPLVIENLVNLSGGQVLKFPQVQRQLRQLDLLSSL
ncbi:MAG: 3'-5' exonuclease [Oligoflexia bacterium]|nr:3'-5' exonuclease [Oligoflexia bacterium]